MDQVDLCPAEEELLRMMLGRLSVARTADLEQHLNRCPACLAVVQKLNVESHLLDMLKDRLAEETSSVVPADLRELMKHLARLRPASSGQVAQTAETENEDTPLLTPAQRPDELGRLAHFRVLEQLGSGGMGVVYLAEDTELQRLVALKVLRPRTARHADARAFFLREARAMAAVKHDNVVVVYQIGEAPSADGQTTPFVAMELLEGESFQTWMAAHPRPPLDWVVRLGRQIASGLAALDARGLIHRDVKPANLWLEPPPGWRDDGSRDRAPLGQVGRAKLLDFGLAFAPGALPEGKLVGTPAYMAPEHLRSETLDGRCDLFGLGCVLYELCTGEHPFPDRRSSSTHTVPLPVNDVNPTVPPELADLIGRLLAEDSAARPASARRVVQELAVLENKLDRSGATDTGLQLETRPLPVEPLPDAPLTLPSPPVGGEGNKRKPSPPTGGEGRVRGARRRMRAIGATALIVVAALVGWRIVSTNHRVHESPPPDLTVSPPVDRPPFPDGPPDEFWCKALQQQPPEKHLKFVLNKLEELNPGYNQNKVTGWVEPEAVIRLNERTDFLSDIRPLRCLADLKTLVLSGSAPGRGRLSDLKPLQGLRLYSLKVDCNPHVRDLSPLRGMPLFHLDVADTGVASLAAVAESPLEELRIAKAPIQDLGPLRTLAKLRILDCTGCPIESLEPLAGTPLQQLRLDYHPARDAAILKRLTSLQSINGSSVQDFWRKHNAAK